MDDQLRRYVAAAPLVFAYSRVEPSVTLDWLRNHPDGGSLAAYSIGETAHRVLTIISASGATIGGDDFANETAAADPTALADAIDRLVDANLVVRIGPTLTLTQTALAIAPPPLPSLEDQFAIKSDDAAQLLKVHRLKSPTNRKADRIATIAKYFRSDAARGEVRSKLSHAAAAMLEHLATFGPVVIASARIVENPWQIARVSTIRRFGNGPSPAALSRDPAIAAIDELVNLGLIGVADYDQQLWIWSEAWPLLNQPIVSDWPIVDRPPVVHEADEPASIPEATRLVLTLLTSWPEPALKALKNSEPRLAVADVRKLAKKHGCTEPMLGFTVRLMIAIGLLQRVETSRSGKGRRQTIDHGWVVEPEMAQRWRGLSPAAQWLRLVHEVARTNPFAERAITIWHLGQLDDGHGFDTDDAGFAAWLAHERGPHMQADQIEAELEMLRNFGVVAPNRPIRLSLLGRASATGLEALDELIGAGASTAYVQADLTVTATQTLDPALAAEVATLADPDPEAAYPKYHLSEQRIASAIASGKTIAEILAFLQSMSVGDLPDTVVRLVHDAERLAEKVVVVDAPTVVIFTDPADLVAAARLKSNKLTPISDTIAITEVAASKIHTQLARKGLAPRLASTKSAATPRTRNDAASDLRDRAKYLEEHYGGHGGYVENQIERLLEDAEILADADGHLRVDTPPIVIPASLDTLVVGDR